MKYNRAISPVFATALLLVVGVTSVVYFQGWFNSLESRLFFNTEMNSNTNSLSIEYLEADNLYVRNSGNINLTYTNIKIKNISCNITGTIVSESLNSINLENCLLGEQIGPKHIVIYTETGIYSENEMLRSVLTGNISISFDLSTSCLIGGYTKIFGIEGVSDSHTENTTSMLYAYSVCIDHSVYTLGTSCSGNYVRLFYLDNSSNAHAYTLNTTSYFPYTTWNQICLSSSGGIITSSVNVTDPADGSICIGSMDDPIDNVNGMHMGTSCASGNKIWLKIQ